MKKISSSKLDKKQHPTKLSNLRNKPQYGASDSDCLGESQAEYIDNLQQQIYVLENEITYLRTHLFETNKQHPSMVAESERMVKKLADCHNEIKSMKIELKRKQTSIDLLRSERDRIQKHVDELEERFRKEKCSILEESIAHQKEREYIQNENSKNIQLMQEYKQTIMKLQEENDNLEIDIQQLERERKSNRQFIEELQESKQKLQKEIFETKLKLQSKPSEKNEEAVKVLKNTIEQLHEELETLKRSYNHEHLLRERLTQDNLELIKRHAELETELVEVKSQLREEQSLRSSLEQVHLSTVLESSENMTRETTMKEQINQLNNQLKEESELNYSLEHKLSDEKRLKSQEEEKLMNLQERFDQREEQNKMLKKENITLWRDNTFLNDQVNQFKKELQCKDEEIVHLKMKVQEMQISVEKFIQTNQTASQLVGEKWKQLSQLVQSMQALTNMEDSNT